MSHIAPRGPDNHPKEYPVTCICKAPMVLRYSGKIKKAPWFYGCSTFPKCRATHGCHQQDGRPLGRPADQETKGWRIKAHDAFDTLWQSGKFSRRGAYNWMKQTLNLSDEENHIGMMDTATCQRVIEAVEKEKGLK